MKAFKFESDAEGCFDSLPQATQDLVRELLEDAARGRGGPDCWKPHDDCFEEIECHSRDGFIPFGHNRGGLTYRNFTTLLDYYGGGYNAAHKGANDEIWRQINLVLDERPESAEASDEHLDALGSDDSSIMHEIRFMYHGCENGVHRASVSCAVNTEGPYHRSHISWAPNVFCEGAKEVEITWKTDGGLARKLKRALAETSKAVF
jgi:hypothetical protein